MDGPPGWFLPPISGFYQRYPEICQVTSIVLHLGGPELCVNQLTDIKLFSKTSALASEVFLDYAASAQGAKESFLADSR